MTTALITGGSGHMASMLRPHLAETGWAVRLLDLVAPTRPLPNEQVIVGSILEPAVLAEACAGVDLVVHLAGHPSERPWADILSLNVDGTRCVLEAARAAGVARVLIASSTHAVGMVPFSELAAEGIAPRPDGYYGFSKAAAEALAALYAERFGMTVVSARIGNANTGNHETLRSRLIWLSAADAARLVRAVAALHSPGHHLVWGMSLGAQQLVSLEAGRRIGYHPQDDARLAEDIGVIPDGPCGGGFAEFPVGGIWGAPQTGAPPLVPQSRARETLQRTRVRTRAARERWRRRR
jgi:uronate dehydrogenase